MKKLFAVLISLIIVLGLCACGDKQEEEKEEVEFSRGTVVDNVYTSEYANLKFAPSEDWVFASDEEIAEIMGYTSDEFILEDFQESIANNEYKSIYDFMAQDNVTGANVIVSYENLALTVGGTSYDEEAYADATRELLSDMTTSNIAYTFTDNETVEFAGEEYLTFSAEADYGGVLIDQIYYLRKIDKYMLAIIVSGQNDYMDTILSYFSEAE